MYVYVRVVKHPKESCEIFAESVLEHEWIMVVRALDVLTGRGRVRELVPEVRGFANEEITVDPEQIVLNLG